MIRQCLGQRSLESISCHAFGFTDEHLRELARNSFEDRSSGGKEASILEPIRFGGGTVIEAIALFLQLRGPIDCHKQRRGLLLFRQVHQQALTVRGNVIGHSNSGHAGMKKPLRRGHFNF